MNGYMKKVQRIKESATPIDNVNKFAWYDDDYETVEVWHEYTAEELARIAEAEAEAEKQKQIEALPEAVSDIQDALVEVAEMTANNEVSMADVQDALVELAGMVSSLLED